MFIKDSNLLPSEQSIYYNLRLGSIPEEAFSGLSPLNQLNQTGADVVRWNVGEVIRAREKMELSSAQRSKILLYL